MKVGTIVATIEKKKTETMLTKIPKLNLFMKDSAVLF